MLYVSELLEGRASKKEKADASARFPKMILV